MGRNWSPKQKVVCNCGWQGKRTKRCLRNPCPRCRGRVFPLPMRPLRQHAAGLESEKNWGGRRKNAGRPKLLVERCHCPDGRHTLARAIRLRLRCKNKPLEENAK
jgi:hypothetical protein